MYQRVRLAGDLYERSTLWCISPDARFPDAVAAFREATEAVEDVIFPLIE